MYYVITIIIIFLFSFLVDPNFCRSYAAPLSGFVPSKPVSVSSESQAPYALPTNILPLHLPIYLPNTYLPTYLVTYPPTYLANYLPYIVQCYPPSRDGLESLMTPTRPDVMTPVRAGSRTARYRIFVRRVATITLAGHFSWLEFIATCTHFRSRRSFYA